MSTNILLNYKKGGVTHTASNDLESIVYILIWICVLYTAQEPFGKTSMSVIRS